MCLLMSQSTAPVNYLPSSTTKQVIHHKNFSLSYSEKHEQAEWVAYELTANEAQGVVARGDDFRPDPAIKTGSADLPDYQGTGYDRGHLAPAADMKFSEKAMSECFYMSNMSPQEPLFNRGIWKNLEDQTRRWAIENEKLYVVTGPVLAYSKGVIGRNKVTVPKYYYKILVDHTAPDVKAIAFIMPNTKCVKPLQAYVVSIDSVEKITGIDFFYAFPDALERKLESRTMASSWSFRAYKPTVATAKTKNYRKPSATRSVSVQCSAKTKAGSRCSRKTLNASGRCWQHE